MLDPVRSLDALFTPFDLKALHVPNRIAMAPMTREFCPGGVPGRAIAEYYSARAVGGAGLIVTEGTAISQIGMRNEYIPRFYGDDAFDGWRVVVDAVHSSGAAIIPQLWHIGIQQTDTVLNPDVAKKPARMIGPSGLTGSGEKVGPPMTTAEIEETIADFGAATAAAKRLGFDGVAIHGAHGYLLDQFLWSFTNRRSDRYAGGLAERSRFAADVVRECRRRGGPDFPIVFRFSQWKVFDYEARLASTPQELEAILVPLVDAGVDIFDCSTRRFESPAFPESPANLAAWTKKVTGKPSMAVGSITLDVDFKAGDKGIAAGSLSLATLGAAAEGLARGDFDLIAVGRAMISNPDWANKVRCGALHQLTPFVKDHLLAL